MCRVERQENAEVMRGKVKGQRHDKEKIRSERSGSLTIKRVKLLKHKLIKDERRGEQRWIANRRWYKVATEKVNERKRSGGKKPSTKVALCAKK